MKNEPLLHVAMAVKSWSMDQRVGTAVSAKEASAIIKAMFPSKTAQAGCGPASVTNILLSLNWAKSGRVLVKQPVNVRLGMPIKQYTSEELI